MKSAATRTARAMARPLQRKIASLKADQDPKVRKIGEAMDLQWQITEVLLNIEEGRQSTAGKPRKSTMGPA